MCGTTHKTVKRVVERHKAGGAAPARRDRSRNYDDVRGLVAGKVAKSYGRISAKRLLPAARAAGYAGSARNFRRLVAQAKAAWRGGHHRGRRPATWTPGDTLVIDWGSRGRLHVFCAVLAWSRFRFVRFAADEKATTTLGLLAECFEILGGVPATVLADRMGCLKAGVVANVVVPAPEYVRFAAHYGFRPDFCEAADPESKRIVEHLVGYAKRDLVVPAEPGVADLAAANNAAAAWCAEVNAAVHSEICAVPAERLKAERELLGGLPSLRLEAGGRAVSRKAGKLSCVRFGSARYSVPSRLIGSTVLVNAAGTTIRIIEPFTGEVAAEHPLVALRQSTLGNPQDRPQERTRAPTGG
jgi:transposase